MASYKIRHTLFVFIYFFSGRDMGFNLFYLIKEKAMTN